LEGLAGRVGIAIMTEYAAYFDDSGHPDDRELVVVAGFIAKEEQWLIFEREWKAIIKPLGIRVFHMVDFESSAKWSRSEKDVILNKLISLIRTRTGFHISNAVLMNDYRKINGEYVLEEAIGTPYALTGRTVAKDINSWKRHYLKKHDHLLVFFEDGTKHKGDFMEAMKRDKLPCPAFVDKKEAVSVQAADLFAWEVCYGLTTNHERATLKRLLSHPGKDGLYDGEALESLVQRIHVPLRAALPANVRLAYHSSPKRLRRRTIK
jgi:Protein of unknown function (DUF3800)